MPKCHYNRIMRVHLNIVVVYSPSCRSRLILPFFWVLCNAKSWNFEECLHCSFQYNRSEISKKCAKKSICLNMRINVAKHICLTDLCALFWVLWCSTLALYGKTDSNLKSPVCVHTQNSLMKTCLWHQNDGKVALVYAFIACFSWH